MKNVCTVTMYGDSFDLFAINIAANVIAGALAQGIFAAQCSFVCKYGTEKAAAYNEIIILFTHTNSPSNY